MNKKLDIKINLQILKQSILEYMPKILQSSNVEISNMRHDIEIYNNLPKNYGEQICENKFAIKSTSNNYEICIENISDISNIKNLIDIHKINNTNECFYDSHIEKKYKLLIKIVNNFIININNAQQIRCKEMFYFNRSCKFLCSTGKELHSDNIKQYYFNSNNFCILVDSLHKKTEKMLNNLTQLPFEHFKKLYVYCHNYYQNDLQKYEFLEKYELLEKYYDNIVNFIQIYIDEQHKNQTIYNDNNSYCVADISDQIIEQINIYQKDDKNLFI